MKIIFVAPVGHPSAESIGALSAAHVATPRALENLLNVILCSN